MNQKITDPIISIDRASMKIAIFDDFDILSGFVPYIDEKIAISDAFSWLAQRTSIHPRVIYPKITKISMRS